MITPITTHESATLNTGQMWKSMKSTTPPETPVPCEHAVGEVPERAAQDQAESDRHRQRGHAPGPDDDRDADQCARGEEDPGMIGEQAERAAGVGRVREVDDVRDDRDRRTAGEVLLDQ